MQHMWQHSAVSGITRHSTLCCVRYIAYVAEAPFYCFFFFSKRLFGNIDAANQRAAALVSRSARIAHDAICERPNWVICTAVFSHTSSVDSAAQVNHFGRVTGCAFRSQAGTRTHAGLRAAGMASSASCRVAWWCLPRRQRRRWRLRRTLRLPPYRLLCRRPGGACYH